MNTPQQIDYSTLHVKDKDLRRTILKEVRLYNKAYEKYKKAIQRRDTFIFYLHTQKGYAYQTIADYFDLTKSWAAFAIRQMRAKLKGGIS